MANPEVLLLTAPGCRRSQRVKLAFEKAGIPFREIPLTSEKGTALAARHRVRASPGILIHGKAVDVFTLFPGCKIRPEVLKKRLAEV
jgi:glutaredoxin